MAHTQHDKKKLIARIRRIQGQLTGVEAMLDEGRGCYETLQALASSRGALTGLISELLEGHIRHHVVDEDNRREIKQAGEEVISVIRSFLK